MSPGCRPRRRQGRRELRGDRPAGPARRDRRPLRRAGARALARRQAPRRRLGFVTTHGGRTETDLDALAWAREAIERGAGELLVNSIDADGTKRGFDLELIAAMRAAELRAGDRERGRWRGRGLRAGGRGGCGRGARGIRLPQRRTHGRRRQACARRGRDGGAMNRGRRREPSSPARASRRTGCCRRSCSSGTPRTCSCSATWTRRRCGAPSPAAGSRSGAAAGRSTGARGTRAATSRCVHVRGARLRRRHDPARSRTARTGLPHRREILLRRGPDRCSSTTPEDFAARLKRRSPRGAGHPRALRRRGDADRRVPQARRRQARHVPARVGRARAASGRGTRSSASRASACSPSMGISRAGWTTDCRSSARSATITRLRRSRRSRISTTRWSTPHVVGHPPLTGGLVGFIGWEAIRQLEHLPDVPPADFDVPGQALGFVSELVVLDHRRGTVLLIAAALGDGVEPRGCALGRCAATARRDAGRPREADRGLARRGRPHDRARTHAARAAAPVRAGHRALESSTSATATSSRS